MAAAKSYAGNYDYIEVPGEHHSRTGRVFKVAHVGYFYRNKEKLHFELRPLFKIFHPSDRSLGKYINKCLRLERDCFISFARELGFEKECAILRPPRAVQEGQWGAMTAFTREVDTIDVVGYILYHLYYVVSKRSHANRLLATSSLVGLFNRLLDVETTPWFALMTMPRIDQRRWFCSKEIQEGVCCHLREVQEKVLEFFDIQTPQERLARQLGLLAELYLSGCAACTRGFHRMVETLARYMRDSAEPYIVKKFNVNEVGGGNRGTRWNEHLKRLYAERIMQERLATQGRQTAKVVHSIPQKTIEVWETKSLLAYRAAGERTLKDASGVFTSYEDATPLGNPANETQVYVWHAVEQNKSMLTPNKVFFIVI